MPQTYMPAWPGTSGRNDSLRRVSVLWMCSTVRHPGSRSRPNGGQRRYMVEIMERIEARTSLMVLLTAWPIKSILAICSARSRTFSTSR